MSVPEGIMNFWEYIYDEDAPKIMITGTRRRRDSYFEYIYGIPIIRTRNFIIKGEVKNVRRS